ncbi:MAG: hypothetical protein B6D55_05015 [Candidatus Omnitrophica bacterium 4484_70.2]|nr:MAG: hypothetical protein B6D55_05015 [Candidatus Omnitrophica bacterium 4484_70.2]
MSSFPVSDINRVAAHPAKGISWSKSAIIIKRLPFPKGAIPPHLKPYTERFKEAVRECRGQIKTGLGSATVNAFNACIAAKLKK